MRFLLRHFTTTKLSIPDRTGIETAGSLNVSCVETSVRVDIRPGVSRGQDGCEGNG